MPNGMYIRGGKRRGCNRLSDAVSHSPKKDIKTNEAATSIPIEGFPSLVGNTTELDCKTVDTEEATAEPRRSSGRQTRSKRNVSQVRNLYCVLNFYPQLCDFIVFLCLKGILC